MPPAEADPLLHDVALALLRADPATAPAEGLAVIGPAFDADRAWLVRFDAAMTQWWVAYEWCAPGVSVCLPDLPGVPIALLARPLLDLQRGRPVVYHDIEKIPADAQPLKEEMRREGNRATAGAPLFRDDRLVALIGLDDVRKIHRWSAADMHALQRLGELILAAADRAAAPARSPRRRVPPSRGLHAPEGCYLRAGDCHVQVRWDEIVAVSAAGDYSRIHLRGGREFFEPRNLAVWETTLPGARFGRVHRSWIVAWRCVSRLERVAGGRWRLHLQGWDRSIPVGRRFQSRVRDRMNLHAV